LSTTLTQQTSKKLRDLVASAIAGEKASDVPAVCQRYGLATGTDEEAFRSKFRYVSSRLQRLATKHVLEIAQRVQYDMPTFELGELLSLVTEQDGPRITELTRRRIVEALQGIPLAGRLPELEFFEKVWPLEKMPSSIDRMAHSMRDLLIQHPQHAGERGGHCACCGAGPQDTRGAVARHRRGPGLGWCWRGAGAFPGGGAAALR